MMMSRSLTFSMLIFTSVFAFTLRALSTENEFNNSIEKRIDAIVSVFENGTPDIQYNYIEALDDHRGYTAGRSGFTTATGDLLDVVERYQSKNPAQKIRLRFERILPLLRELKKTGSDQIKGLEKLPSLWKTAALDAKFRLSQDEIANELYRVPAQEKCRALGIKTALGFLIIFDSIIQHGNGDDEDSLSALIKRTGDLKDEKEFIRNFLDVRQADLMNPFNKGTTDEWRESVGRVEALRQLVLQNQWNLDSSVRLMVWNKTYQL